MWKRVLRVERAGLDDNFFDLGGDSLLLLAVHSNLQKTLHIEIPITDLFEFTTVRTLAARLIKQQPAPPSFSDVRQQAQKQREAFARERERRSGRCFMSARDSSEPFCEGVAIIGMAGRFPGARTVAEFWRNQLNGVESISHFTVEDLEVPGRGGVGARPKLRSRAFDSR